MLQIVRHTTRSVGRRRWLFPKRSKPTSTQQKQQQIEELQAARDRELLLQSYEQSLKGVTPKEQAAVTEAFIRKNQQSVKVMEDKNAIAKSPSTMSNHEWMMHANAHYRATFADKVGSLPIIPARHMTIVTCMDARIDPGKAMGIAEGDCHIIRNAGARIKDALRSLIISQEMMGTREVAIIHHTNCGACTLNEKDLIARIAKREQPADASDIDFMSFNNPDVFENVRREIQIYKQYQTLVQGIPVKGYVFDVKTGTLHHVHENANIEQEIADAQTKTTTTATTESTSQQSSQNEQKEQNTINPTVTAAATATAAAVAVASADDEQADESQEMTPSSPLTAGGLSGSLTRFMKLLSSNSF